MEKENKIFGSDSFVLIVMGEWTVQKRRAYSLEANGYSGLMGGIRIRMNRRKKERVYRFKKVGKAGGLVRGWIDNRYIRVLVGRCVTVEPGRRSIR